MIRGLSPGTIRVYLYSLSAEVKRRGGPGFLVPRGSWFIHSTMKAIKKDGPHAAGVFRRPITVPILSKLVQSVDLGFGDNLLFCAMASLGIFGCCRIGEVCGSVKRGVKIFIRLRDVVFHPNYVEVTLHNTKTAPIVKKYIANIDGALNPWQLLHSYRCTRIGARREDAFFVHGDGKMVKRPEFIAFLRDNLGKIFPGIPREQWNGASLRKGGASSAVQAGVQSDIVETMGNWKTKEYKKYVHCSIYDVIAAQKASATLQLGSHLQFSYPHVL